MTDLTLSRRQYIDTAPKIHGVQASTTRTS
jgi:hypothetical protein